MDPTTFSHLIFYIVPLLYINPTCFLAYLQACVELRQPTFSFRLNNYIDLEWNFTIPGNFASLIISKISICNHSQCSFAGQLCLEFGSSDGACLYCSVKLMELVLPETLLPSRHFYFVGFGYFGYGKSLWKKELCIRLCVFFTGTVLWEEEAL